MRVASLRVYCLASLHMMHEILNAKLEARLPSSLASLTMPSPQPTKSG